MALLVAALTPPAGEQPGPPPVARETGGSQPPTRVQPGPPPVAAAARGSQPPARGQPGSPPVAAGAAAATAAAAAAAPGQAEPGEGGAHTGPPPTTAHRSDPPASCTPQRHSPTAAEGPRPPPEQAAAVTAAETTPAGPLERRKPLSRPRGAKYGAPGVIADRGGRDGLCPRCGGWWEGVSCGPPPVPGSPLPAYVFPPPSPELPPLGGYWGVGWVRATLGWAVVVAGTLGWSWWPAVFALSRCRARGWWAVGRRRATRLMHSVWGQSKAWRAAVVGGCCWVVAGGVERAWASSAAACWGFVFVWEPRWVALQGETAWAWWWGLGVLPVLLAAGLSPSRAARGISWALGRVSRVVRWLRVSGRAAGVLPGFTEACGLAAGLGGAAVIAAGALWVEVLSASDLRAGVVAASAYGLATGGWVLVGSAMVRQRRLANRRGWLPRWSWRARRRSRWVARRPRLEVLLPCLRPPLGGPDRRRAGRAASGESGGASGRGVAGPGVGGGPVGRGLGAGVPVARVSRLGWGGGGRDGSAAAGVGDAGRGDPGLVALRTAHETDPPPVRNVRAPPAPPTARATCAVRDLEMEEDWTGVDEVLSQFGGSRVPNQATGDCLFAALTPTAALPSHDDIVGMRSELSRRAGDASVKPQLLHLLGDARRVEEYRAGLAGAAHGNHLALHLAAGAWDLSVVVVQEGRGQAIRVDPRRPKKQGPAPADVRVVALSGNHYEGVAMPLARRRALRESAAPAHLSPATCRDACPAALGEGAQEAEGAGLGDVRRRWFCPLTACAGSALHRHTPYSSKETLRKHAQAHADQGEEFPPSALRLLGMKKCMWCSKVMSTSLDSCVKCRPRGATPVVPNRRAPSAAEAADAGRLPPLESIHTERVGVSLSVPGAILRPAAVAYSQALWDVAANSSSTTAWLRLLLVPKTLFRTYRGGKKKQLLAKRAREEAIILWREGRASELWRRARTEAPGPGRVEAAPTWEETEEAVVQAARQGRYSAAMARTRSAGLAPATPATKAKLLAMHPEADSPAISAATRVVPADATPAEVFKALKGLPRGTGAGPSGLRADHLRELVQVEGVDVLPALTAVVNVLRRGEAPPQLARHIAGASLVALPKPDAGIRPIAVGETLRRLVAKTLTADVREQAGKLLLKGRQVGVAVDGGLEAATAVVKDFAARNRGADKVLLKIDYANAFNMVNRQAFIDAVRRDLPELSAWVEWCYASPSALIYRGEVLESQRGVQQGDPLGPLLFSLAIRQLTEDLGQGSRASGGASGPPASGGLRRS